MRIDYFGISGVVRELLWLGKNPQAEAYFELAHDALMEGNHNLAKEYLSKTEEAIENGVAFTVFDGKKPLDENYHCNRQAVLKVVS